MEAWGSSRPFSLAGLRCQGVLLIEGLGKAPAGAVPKCPRQWRFVSFLYMVKGQLNIEAKFCKCLRNLFQGSLPSFSKHLLSI